MFQNILLAVDGSSHALKAARLAGEICRTMNTPLLRVVTIYDRIPAFIGEPYLQQTIDERLAEANRILEEALQAIGPLPAPAHTEIVEGPAAEAILKVAETRSNDLIIMGTRGRGTLAGLLLGSQSQKVVAHAACPVLLAR